jgi:2-succinyl-5-enolpyruvyl-6-hydroxy-3-cyclohexene-1-carboxylate synthase
VLAVRHDPADVQATWCATLVDQWVRDGLTHAFVAPGSRSTPMALALAARRDVRVEVFHDERSAAFAALGAGLVSGVPAAVLCTSGTAATHFHAAVVEAHLSGVPMLVLTADRPPELRDVAAPQTIDQTKLFGSVVRWFHDPGVPDDAALPTCRSLARHAWEATIGARPGPVHLNLPFREPLVGRVFDLPDASLGAVAAVSATTRLGALSMIVDRERGVIVAGAGVDDPVSVLALSAATGWPVFADARSGCRIDPALGGAADAVVVTAFDGVLRHEGFADAHTPEVVLAFGEPPASKVLSQWLAAAGAAGATHVRVTPDERFVDPSHVVTHRVVHEIGALCRRLAGELAHPRPDEWRSRWRDVSDAADHALAAEVVGATLTEPAVARIVGECGDDVVVASSMPVRDLEWFGPPAGGVVRSNRGANGIDGTVATAIGVAAASGRTQVVLLGDVALLHDQSSLTALRHRAVDVRIVVVDNDGGGIFSFLPQAASLDAAQFEQVFGTPHGTDLVALAAAHGLPCAVVSTPDELRGAVAESGSRIVVARVSTDRETNVVEHRRLNDAVVAAIDALPR